MKIGRVISLLVLIYIKNVLICLLNINLAKKTVVYKIPYRRAPRLAFRPSASREQRYLAYKEDRGVARGAGEDTFGQGRVK